MKNKKYMLGIIGCGHMGLAIARGSVMDEYLERYQISIYDPSESMKQICSTESFTLMDSDQECAANSHIVLLAVTPQVIDETLKHLKGTPIDCVLSIVTGVSIAHIKKALGKDVPVIRAMPNTPLQISEGATALCFSQDVKADDYDVVYKMFSNLGVTRTIPEEQMETFVAVHGSTPAYFYTMADALVKDAVKHGIDEEAARALVVQTMIGSGKLLEQDPHKPLSEFIDDVCSKGGTTIEAVNVLQEQKLEEIITAADARCIARANELGKK